MSRRKRGNKNEEGNGFAQWGGYMAAKKAKLQDQFMIDAAKEAPNDDSRIFHGVSIFVNGYSVPSADELKLLMMKHGGIYHHYYQSGKTTHIIATNLPDTKIKKLKTMNVVKPDWIVDSISARQLLDYRQYLLYSRQSKTQPKIMFKQTFEVEIKPTTSTAVSEDRHSGEEYEEQCPNLGQMDQSIEASKHLKGSSDSSHNCEQNEVEIVNNESNIKSCSKPVQSIKTASEAGFLNEFYSNSRLHHISTMGATFKQYVNNLRQSKSGIFEGTEKLKQWKQNQAGCFMDHSPYKNVIMHIDMDCFFASVGLRERPDLQEFPVAVTHAKSGSGQSISRAGVNRKAEFELYKTRRVAKAKSKNANIDENQDNKPWSDWVEAIDKSNSMAEIASCNYEARKYGLKNGMFLGQALKLCPNLKTIPYNFEGYKEVSYTLYETVASYTLDIEAISCDEMFVDCTSLLECSGVSPLEFASFLRAEIKEKTGCPCSAGFGSNRLQARLATRRAKPDGQFYLEPSAVQTFMTDITVGDLPGVGRATKYKLQTLGVKTCLDLQQLSLSKLQAEFGMKSGESLFKCCRGEDKKKLVFGQVRKSVSAEVNYGIRFQNREEAEGFLKELCIEVHSRLQEINMKTKFITLKCMIKAKDAPVETAKFLGHGVCDSVSRSSSLQVPTSDVEVITSEVIALSHQISSEPEDLRGIGIQLSRLENSKKQTNKANALDKFLVPNITVVNLQQQVESKTNEPVKKNNEPKSETANSMSNYFIGKKRPSKQCQVRTDPNSCIQSIDINPEVLNALPEDIRKEIIKEYGLSEDFQRMRPVGDDGECQPSTSRKVKEPNRAICDLNYSQIDFDVLNELPLDIKKEVVSTIKPKNHEYAFTKSETANSGSIVAVEEGPKLDRSLRLNEMKGLIKAWTGSEDCPQICDIKMMADYFEGLVVYGQLETLDVCVNCLHRYIEKRSSTLWEEAYFSIISSLQSVMVAVYGIHLRVPKTFVI